MAYKPDPAVVFVSPERIVESGGGLYVVGPGTASAHSPTTLEAIPLTDALHALFREAFHGQASREDVLSGCRMYLNMIDETPRSERTKHD